MVTAEDRQRLRREKTREAINLALQSHWEEAAEANRAVLQYFPDDVDAYTRLGKALMELGQLDAARASLDEALKRDAHNQIARRNMERLKAIRPSPNGAMQRASRRLDPRFFIEQSGRSGITLLIGLGDAPALAALSAGDPVNLRVSEGRLVVETPDGVFLGRVEPRLAARLVPLIQGGNRYEAAVVSVSAKDLSVIIREEWQQPSLAHLPSFPIKGPAEDPRALADSSPASTDESEDAEDSEEGEEADESEGDEEPWSDDRDDEADEDANEPPAGFTTAEEDEPEQKGR